MTISYKIAFWIILVFCTIAIVTQYLIYEYQLSNANYLIDLYKNISQQCLNDWNETLNKWAICEGVKLN